MHKGIIFLIFLFALLFVLIGFKMLAKKYLKNNNKYSKEFVDKLSYVYIMFYSTIAGLLIYFGLEDFKNLMLLYIKDVSLCSLISVTIVITFCFIYSALFKEIIEIIFNSKVKINEWTNVQAYVMGRILVIFFIFVIYHKLLKNSSKK